MLTASRRCPAGTIGHVAHGKSTVVKAISGVQARRLRHRCKPSRQSRRAATRALQWPARGGVCIRDARTARCACCVVAASPHTHGPLTPAMSPRALGGHRAQTVRFKNELERNITIKLGYANAKIYKCEDESCPRPACYRCGQLPARLHDLRAHAAAPQRVRLVQGGLAAVRGPWI